MLEGKVGMSLFFSTACLITTFSGSVSIASCPGSIALGDGCVSSLPLLSVMIALTSFSLEFGSLEELTSCNPLGVWLCLRGKFSLFLHVMLVSQPGN